MPACLRATSGSALVVLSRPQNSGKGQTLPPGGTRPGTAVSGIGMALPGQIAGEDVANLVERTHADARAAAGARLNRRAASRDLWHELEHKMKLEGPNLAHPRDETSQMIPHHGAAPSKRR